MSTAITHRQTNVKGETVTTRNLKQVSSKAHATPTVKFNLLRNAKVEVEAIMGVGRNGAPKAPQTKFIIANKYEHTFSETSRLSRALNHMTPADLQERFNRGTFFVIDGGLVDLRDRHYDDFVHDDEAIGQLLDLIGVRQVPGRDRRALGLKTVHPSIVLSGIYNKREINIPMYKEGGAFTSQLMFNWNPFQHDIKAVYELVRQICRNGMLGVSDYLNTNVPVINRWQEHMEIAARQIQNKVNDRTVMRLSEMSSERATLKELILLANHAQVRLSETKQADMVPEMRKRLSDIYKTVNPVFHLSKKYAPGAFVDSNLAAQLPGHLSTFDVFNIATEMYTHTDEVDKSSGFALQRFANGLMFDPFQKREQRLTWNDAKSIEGAFSNASVAFAGQMTPPKE